MYPLRSRLALAALLVLVPASAAAQNQAYGTAWIHRDAPIGTRIHALDDTLCIVGFPAYCYGGMMRPDSLLCTWQITPPDSMPEPMSLYCGVAIQCEIVDDNGQMMMPGHMTSPGLFSVPVSIAIHYDPAVMAARGIDPANLILTTWINGQPTVLESAIHDQESSLLTLSTTQLTEWYGVADSTRLAPTITKPSTWGEIKAKYPR